MGWIDGVRHRLDARSYTIRFTPRQPGSHWSAVNIARVRALQALGRMQPAGLAAFERRTDARSATASYEQDTVSFPPEDATRFRRDAAAWSFFHALPPSYRKKVTWWVISARLPATRERRLASLIAACAQGRRL